MTYSRNYLDQIRQRLPLSQIVGLHVPLHRQGREWTGRSPFEGGGQNTLFVNDERGVFYDFANDKHGDAFDFVIEVEGLTREAAVRRLAEMAGIPFLAA